MKLAEGYWEKNGSSRRQDWSESKSWREKEKTQEQGFREKAGGAFTCSRVHTAPGWPSLMPRREVQSPRA